MTLEKARIALDRDAFLGTILSELSGALEKTVGLREASGAIGVVGQVVGGQLDDEYRRVLQVPRLTREQVAAVCVDLKRRIGGDFYVIEQDDHRIVFGNRACPFQNKVHDRPSMCMVTSSVFGSIAARNLGYAKVELQQTIARGDDRCRVVLHLTTTAASERVEGQEYFGAVEGA